MPEVVAATLGDVVCILPGRSIAFSPEWRDDGLSVLFDRNSGDYWIVSALARKIVENVAHDDGRDAGELVQIALCALSPDEKEGETAELARKVIDELIRREILVRIDSPRSVPPIFPGPTVE